MPAPDLERRVAFTQADWPDGWPDYDEPGIGRIFNQAGDIYYLQHACPGCGKIGSIPVGIKEKPNISQPSWKLASGDPNDPRTWTLTPSIHCIGCCGWHGYLQGGEFVPCSAT